MNAVLDRISALISRGGGLLNVGYTGMCHRHRWNFSLRKIQNMPRILNFFPKQALTFKALLRNDTIHYNTIQYNTIRCDAMRCDAMRCDAMRCDAMRCDAIRYDINILGSRTRHTFWVLKQGGKFKTLVAHTRLIKVEFSPLPLPPGSDFHQIFLSTSVIES